MSLRSRVETLEIRQETTNTRLEMIECPHEHLKFYDGMFGLGGPHFYMVKCLICEKELLRTLDYKEWLDSQEEYHAERLVDIQEKKDALGKEK
jgi:hypothetical protein